MIAAAAVDAPDVPHGNMRHLWLRWKEPRTIPRQRPRLACVGGCGRMDDPVSETNDRNNPYFIVAPAFPKGVTIAGIIWIIIGAFLLLMLAWWESVLILALATSDRGMSQEDWIVTNILMAVVLGSFAF